MHIVFNGKFAFLHFVRDSSKTSGTTNPVRPVSSPVIEKAPAIPPPPVEIAPVTPVVNLPEKENLVTTPAPKIDMLDVIRFNVPGFCNTGEYDCLLKDPTLLIHVKNPVGYPIDLIYYDEFGLYDQGTEVNWVDFAFNKFHVANGGRGNLMCPRYLPTTFPFSTPEADSPELYIKDGKYDFRPETAGPVSNIWYKPFMKDWGGDVKNVLTYQRDMFWSGKKNREQFFYAPPFSLVKWNHGNLQSVKQPDGSYYKIDNDPAVNNKLESCAYWKVNEFTYKYPFLSVAKFPRGTY